MTVLSTTLSSLFGTSAADRSAAVQKTFDLCDRNGDLEIDFDEFRRMFLRLSAERAEAAERTAASSSAWSVGRTLFDCTLAPSFSPALAKARYQAASLLAEYDLDENGRVGVLEFAESVATAGSPADAAEGSDETGEEAPPDAAARADALMARYDVARKGHIDLADIAQAWMNDPKLGDPAAAPAAIEAWDLDGDGRVSRDELVRGFEIMDAADAIMTALDPAGSGVVDLSKLSATADLVPDLPTLYGWDYDADGKLTRAEVIQGLKTPAASTDPASTARMLLANFDRDRSGGLDEAEFADLSATDGATADFAAWDENGDGKVDAAELASGIALVRTAQEIVGGYDLAGKGWFDADDIRAAIDASGDTTSTVEGVMAWWDADGDGRVTVSEVVSGIEAGGYVAGRRVAAEPGTAAEDGTTEPPPA